MPNEQQEFLKQFEPQNRESVLDQPLMPNPEKEEAQPESQDDPVMNRRGKRLMAQLQAEKEANIALSARLAAVTEMQKFRSESESSDDYLKKVESIYGTDTPEAKLATDLLKQTLSDVERRATERAIEAMQEQQEQATKAVADQEQVLDSMIDDLEDETGQTIDKQTQSGFFALLEKLSPKDADGNVVAYADHFAVWEEYQSRKAAPQNNRAKDLASRSMVRTGATPATNVQDDATERYLRENGII